MNKKLREIFDELNSKYGVWREENEELLKSADEAIERMKNRKEESVEEWAERLADDFFKE